MTECLPDKILHGLHFLKQQKIVIHIQKKPSGILTQTQRMFKSKSLPKPKKSPHTPCETTKCNFYSSAFVWIKQGYDDLKLTYSM